MPEIKTGVRFEIDYVAKLLYFNYLKSFGICTK